MKKAAIMQRVGGWGWGGWGWGWGEVRMLVMEMECFCWFGWFYSLMRLFWLILLIDWPFII
jgi:hypothetical protein